MKIKTKDNLKKILISVVLIVFTLSLCTACIFDVTPSDSDFYSTGSVTKRYYENGTPCYTIDIIFHNNEVWPYIDADDFYYYQDGAMHQGEWFAVNETTFQTTHNGVTTIVSCVEVKSFVYLNDDVTVTLRLVVGTNSDVTALEYDGVLIF